MEQVSPGFSERYLLDPWRFQSELTEYRRYIKSMVELAGAGNMSASYANEILHFSTKIAEVSAAFYILRNFNPYNALNLISLPCLS